jgi:hypothetical protein
MAEGLGPGDPVEVGEGRYELTARLRRGGMGTVYLGRSSSVACGDGQGHAP